MSVLAPLGLSCLAEDAEPVGCPAGTVLVEQGEAASSHVLLLVQVRVSCQCLLRCVKVAVTICVHGTLRVRY